MLKKKCKGKCQKEKNINEFPLLEEYSHMVETGDYLR